MPTQCAITRSISIAAPPAEVLAVVGEPTELPRWAPAFASSIRPDGDAWLVTSGAVELRIRVRCSPELGTVDFLAAGTPPGDDVGAFGRVISNGDGGEFLFTVFLPAAATEAQVAHQAAEVEAELRAVRALCEASRAKTGGGRD